MQHLQGKKTRNCKFHPPPQPSGGNFGVKSVKLLYFFKNLLYSGAWSIQTKYIVMMTKEGSTKIVNLMTPGAGVLVQGHGHISCIVKMHCFFKNLLLFSQALNRQSKLNSYDDQGRVYQNYKFYDPWGRGSLLVRGHISHIVKFQMVGGGGPGVVEGLLRCPFTHTLCFCQKGSE